MKIGESPIRWISNQQKLVVALNNESELLNLCDIICIGKWLMEILEELAQEEMVKCPIQISTDSQSVTDWLKQSKG